LLPLLVRRALFVVPVLFGVSVLTFSMAHLGPVDTARIIAGPTASPEKVEALRREWGLDRPLYQQYIIYVRNALRGDLGRSFITRANVVEEVLAVFPYTVELVGLSVVLATAVGIPCATLAAMQRGSAVDRTTVIVAITGLSLPAFLVGLLLVYFFSFRLGWFPISGRLGPLWTTDGLWSACLPAITLAAIQLGSILRVARASMIEALSSDYIRTARAKGVSEALVAFKHGLRNAVLPLITIIGWQIGWLLGGAVVTETVFAWPGLGRLTVNAILNRDFPLVQGAVLLGATAYVLVNVVVDVLYVVLNPRTASA
jgi:glutathione transport system permease protein